MRILSIILACMFISFNALAEKASNHFAFAFNMWDTGNFKNKTIKTTSGAAQGYFGHHSTWTHGWCNDLINYALIETGLFDSVKVATGDIAGIDVMRGRHWHEMNNENVTTLSKGQDLDVNNLTVGSVIMLDFNNGQPNYESVTLGIDHVSMFMGYVDDKPGYGWFLGGNQNATLQPKMYKLDHVIFETHINDTSKYHIEYHKGIHNGYMHLDHAQYFVDGNKISFQDYSLTDNNVIGGKNDAWHVDGMRGNNQFHNNDSNNALWEQYGPTVQKFENGVGTIYIETDKPLEVHGNVVVTEEYKQEFINSVKYAVFTHSDDYIDAGNEKTAWVSKKKVFRKRAWKWRNDDPKFLGYVMQYFNHVGMTHIANGFKDKHKYTAAGNAIVEADKKVNVGEYNKNSELGQEKLAEWSEYVVEGVLDDGYVMKHFGLTSVATMMSPYGEIN